VFLKTEYGEGNMSLDTPEAGEGNSQPAPQPLEQFQQLPANVQRLIIGLALLTVLVGLAMARSKIQTIMDSKTSEPADEEAAPALENAGQTEE
jgi:hypothetical protein